MRVKVTLACTECEQRNYDTTKNKKNNPDRIEMKKHCRFCRKHTLHKETKQSGGKTMGNKKNNTDKQSVFSKIKKFFLDYKVEFKKIVWPTQKTVFKNTGVVLTMIFIMGIFVAALDVGFRGLLGLVMSVSSNIN